MADIRFINELLVFSEGIDYVHIYDDKTYLKHQEIDGFGEVVGMDTFGDKLFFGLMENTLSCLMEYELIRSDKDCELIKSLLI